MIVKHLLLREDKIDILNNAVYGDKKRIVLITGVGGIGKTALASQFISPYFYNKGIPSDNPFYTELTNPNTGLKHPFLLVDFDNSDTFKNLDFINRYLLENSESIVFLTSRYETSLITDLLSRVNSKLIFRFELDNLSMSNAKEFIESRLIDKSKLNDELFHKIYSLSQGHPLFLITFLEYFSNNSYSLEETLSQLSISTKQKGIFDNYGKPITEKSQEFKQIKSDIIIVDSKILDIIDNNPAMIYNLSPRQFEEIIFEILHKQGYNVKLTPITKDGGKDILIATNEMLGNFLFYVECKKYSPNRPVGVNLVRELYGTVTADRATAGLLITTSYFTKKAIEFKDQVKHQISLMDYVGIVNWIKKINNSA